MPVAPEWFHSGDARQMHSGGEVLRAGFHANSFPPRSLSGLAARGNPNIPRRAKALKRISGSRCCLSDADIIRRSSGPRADRATPPVDGTGGEIAVPAMRGT